MVILFLLSLHIFLLLLYALAIETRRSRHSFKALAFAACLPFAGELCLFVSEFGKTESEFDSSRVFRFRQKEKQVPKGGHMEAKGEITRDILLTAIEEKPDNLVEILKRGLRSSDMEVVHVAAATIMKLQREQELSVAQKAEEYREFPDDMQRLLSYIKAVGGYYEAELLEGEAQNELLYRQEKDLRTLLEVLPDHAEGNLLMAKNLMRQGRREESLELCERRRRNSRDYAAWELSYLLYRESGQPTDTLFKEASAVSGDWLPEQQKAWYAYERSAGYVEA